MAHQEYVYLNLLRKIIAHGATRKDRTGTGTKSLFAEQIRFDISKSVPLLTTKFVPWKAVIKELIWFMKGQTDAKLLSTQGVRIWDGNTTRSFLDGRGLSHLEEGDIGAGYGFQWRHFGAKYKTCTDTYEDEGFDQLQHIIDQLKNDPYSRRIFLSAWNPLHMADMALPPCHVSAQFYVEDCIVSGEKLLSCHMYQRSVDCFLGLPFNIFSYTALTYILAAMCGMKPKELIISTGDTHIYCNHLSQVQEQLARTPYDNFPTLHLDMDKINSCVDVNNITIDDFEVCDYKFHPSIKAPMSI
jgi:thymidylate synthase